ncbi:hypothetical protein EAE96_011156 [Botrytis aclada]|nr:hypothetical protein EAE96_011156 [Botrytis aclada]
MAAERYESQHAKLWARGKLSLWLNYSCLGFLNFFLSSFMENDLIDPRTLRIMCDVVTAVANNLERPEIEVGCVGPQEKTYKSFKRLMMNIGEAVVRSEGVETYLATTLFLSLAAKEVYSHLEESKKSLLDLS